MIKFKNILPSIFFLILFLSTTVFYLYSPYDVLVSDITSTSVTVSWKTRIGTKSYIAVRDNVLEESDSNKFHRITIEDLESDIEYLFLISNLIDWERGFLNSKNLKDYVLSEFRFKTKESKDDIELPITEELNSIQNSLVYYAIYDGNQILGVYSGYTSPYGRLLINKGNNEYSIKTVEVIPDKKRISFVKGVYANSERESISESFILNSGINFIGLNFETDIKASDIINRYSDIILLANFKNGEWIDIVKKSYDSVYIGNDFVFEQGRGYLIVVKENTVIQLKGWVNEDKKIEMKNGEWNLVSGSFFSNSNSNEILELGDSSFKGIAKWDKDVDIFSYHLKNEDTIYGEGFPISNNLGIFFKTK